MVDKEPTTADKVSVNLNIDSGAENLLSQPPLIVLNRRTCDNPDNDKKRNYIKVKSIRIAEAKDEKDPSGKSHIWFFYNDKEVADAFEKLLAEAVACKKEKKKIDSEIDEAIENKGEIN